MSWDRGRRPCRAGLIELVHAKRRPLVGLCGDDLLANRARAPQAAAVFSALPSP
jgi:hypothetical protein